ncbi:MAG: hypothetical protein ACI95X_002890, partial [Paraglaciecola sp.]
KLLFLIKRIFCCNYPTNTNNKISGSVPLNNSRSAS